jgi:VWFA-related protein
LDIFLALTARRVKGFDRMRTKPIGIYAILILLIFSGLARGQETVSLNILDMRSSSGGDVEMVISVVDENGIPVKGLSKADFGLSLEGKEVKEFSLTPYSSAQSPLSVILGIDVSGSMEGISIKEAKRGACIFLDELDKEDCTSLMVFGNSVRFLTDFSRKKHEVREKIEGLQANEKSTLLYQASSEGLDKASKAPTSRVAIVLLTDGRDEGSTIKEEEVMAKVRKARLPIYTLGFGPKAQVEYLKNVASISGGYFLSTPNAEELSHLYRLVLDQLKNQYLLRLNYPTPAGEYKSLLTLRYRDREITARRTFLQVMAESTPGWKAWCRSPWVWGIMGLALVIVGMALLYRFGVFRRLRPKTREKEVELQEELSICLMIKKKLQPLGPSLSDIDSTATVALPSASKGEVGLEIDLKQPLPVSFALIDKKNRREYNEIIITRHDKERDRLFLGEKIYLLLSERSVTRPGGERKGHARIFIDPETGTYQIEDLGSTSGTKVNGKGLNKGSSLALVSGDTITVGNILMKYYDQRPLMETQF